MPNTICYDPIHHCHSYQQSMTHKGKKKTQNTLNQIQAILLPPSCPLTTKESGKDISNKSLIISIFPSTDDVQ